MSQADPNRPFDCADCWSGLVRCERHRLAPDKPAQPGSGEVRRWNIDRDGDDLLICFDYHDKGEKCEYERYVPASALTAAQQRIAELESELENERARGIHTCHDQCQRPLCVAQRRIAAITAMAQAQRGCKSPHTSWSPAGVHRMLVQLHDLILKEPS